MNNFINICNYLLAATIHFSHIAGYVLGGIVVLLCWPYFDRLKNNKFLLLLNVFVVYGLIRALLSSEPAISLNAVLGYFSHWTIPFILGYLVSTDKAFKKTFWIYYTTFFILVGFSVLSYFGLFPEKIGPDLYLSRDGLLKALNSHIGLACLCLLFSFLSLGQVLYRDDLTPFKKRFFIFSICFFLGSLFLTGSRGYYLAAVFTYLIFIISSAGSAKKRMGLIFISIAGLACIVSALYFMAPKLKARIDRTNYSDTSVQERLAIYKVALNEIKARPIFGFGPGLGIKQKEFFESLPEERKNVQTFPHLHSFYLNLAADFGLTGLAMFIIIAFFWLKKLYSYFIFDSGFNKAIAFGLFWGLIGLLAGDMLDTFLRGPRIGMDYFWLTGILFSRAITTKKA